MANTYYDSELTAEEIEEVLEAINGILNPANNGKVLAINSGKIEARSVQWGGGGAVVQPLSVTQNGTYNPPSGVDGYAPVTVNVSSGSDGNFFGASIPTSETGNNGDYYYQYVVSGNIFESIGSDRSSNTLIYGNEFIPLVDMTITALRGHANQEKSGKIRIGDSSQVLAETASATFPAGEWVELPLATPLQLQKGTNYIVQVVIESGTTGAVGYTASSPTVNNDLFKYVIARYGSYPGTSEADRFVNADVVCEPVNRIVTTQYRKKNGVWENLY